MKKLILKTALITLGVVIVLAVAAFGVASLCAPAAMSDFTYSLGMNVISGDYAYQEYERSGDLSYLARSFEIAATTGRDEKAQQRFDALYSADGFDEMCERRNEQTAQVDGLPDVGYDYRNYICGLGACVRYRLAGSDEARQQAISLALAETAQGFPSGNPVAALASEALKAKDAAFCRTLLAAVRAGSFEQNSLYEYVTVQLEEAVNE